MIDSLLELLRLPPERIAVSLALLSGVIIACEYLRITLMVVAPRSLAIHLLCGALTVVIQPILLAVVLILAIVEYPERAAMSMTYIALLYFVWYIAGQSTLLVRRDAQGADAGFMAIGAIVTFGAGLVALAVI